MTSAACLSLQVSKETTYQGHLLETKPQTFLSPVHHRLFAHHVHLVANEEIRVLSNNSLLSQARPRTPTKFPDGSTTVLSLPLGK